MTSLALDVDVREVPMQELRTQALDLIRDLDDERLKLVLDYARHLREDRFSAGEPDRRATGGLEALLDEPL